jgi:hypothetical protein
MKDAAEIRRDRIRRALQQAVVVISVGGLVAIAAAWGPFLAEILGDRARFKAWIDSYGMYAAPSSSRCSSCRFWCSSCPARSPRSPVVTCSAPGWDWS